MILLVIIVTASLAISFLCSILEATLLSSSVGELSSRAEKGDKGAERLLALKKERIDDAISAILTLNTIAHTIGAAMSGAQAATVFGDQWVGVFSGVLTVLILVVTEIIPKTVGTVHAAKLSGMVGTVIAGLIWSMRPILFVTRALTGLVTHGEKEPMSRGELLAMVRIATDEGTIDAPESRAMSNLLRFDEIPISDIMTPRTVMVSVQAENPISELVQSNHINVFSRIPLFEASPDEIMGYVTTRDALKAALDGKQDQPLRSLIRPIHHFSASTSVDDAMKELLDKQEHIAVIGDDHGGISGLVTLEDLVETVLGVEITDEFDNVADLRVLASQLRDKRQARLDALRKSMEKSP